MNLRDEFLWPLKIEAKPHAHSFLADSTRQFLVTETSRRQPKIVLELGAWVGSSTRIFLENSNATVFSVDHWDETLIRPWITKRHPRLLPIVDQGVRETFLANLEEFRDRVVPVQLDTLEAIQRIRGERIAVDLVFLDSSHAYEETLQELHAAESLNAFLCGDDWEWGEDRGFPVQRALKEFAAKKGLEIKTYGNAWALQPRATAQTP